MEMVCGQQGNNGVLNFGASGCAFKESRKVTFQKYIVLDAQRRQTISKSKIDLFQGNYKPKTGLLATTRLI